ncbi:hypothetical protein [Morganella phage Mecenats66]|nr:hypothetical protein [Morganella phage Mecenats66]
MILGRGYVYINRANTGAVFLSGDIMENFFLSSVIKQNDLEVLKDMRRHARKAVVYWTERSNKAKAAEYRAGLKVLNKKIRIGKFRLWIKSLKLTK